MRILFLAPRLPLPADTGGKIRTLNILKQMARNAKTHLVCFAFSQKDDELSVKLRKMGIEVTLIAFEEPGFVKKAASLFFNSTPYSIQKYFSEEMKKTLSSLVQSCHFDAVHIDHLHMAQYRSCFNGQPCILDEHNVEFEILAQCAQVEKSLLKRMLFKHQARKMRRFEQKSIKELSRFFAVAEQDKNILFDLGERKTPGDIVPNGVDTEYFKPSEGNQQSFAEDSLVFTGSMDWLPNKDAVYFFCKEILPLIWKSKPRVKFYCVGRNPTRAIQELSRRERRIVVTGEVDDVRPYLANAKIFVVPLRIGSGTRLKILEAMAVKKAVVSTTLGAQGIACQDDTNIILADDPSTFAQKVVSLLDDDKQRAQLALEGRKLVLEKYDWNRIGREMFKIYREILCGQKK